MKNRGSTNIRLRSRRGSSPGFTLVELLVVTAILTIVTGLVLVNNNKFGGRILLENLAYDIGLSVRQAQVYGISVRQFGAGNFSAGYGMHFSRTNPTSYELFADVSPAPPDGIFESAGGELVQATAIGGGFFITDLRAGPAGGETSVDSLDIVFKRPEPDACIARNGVTPLDSQARCVGGQERGRVVLESPRGDQVSVVVEATGQISVE